MLSRPLKANTSITGQLVKAKNILELRHTQAVLHNRFGLTLALVSESSVLSLTHIIGSAQANIANAGVADVSEIKLGPGLEVLTPDRRGGQLRQEREV